MPRTDTAEIYEPYATPDTFCTSLVRVDHLGPCRRLVFVVSDPGAPCGPALALVAKIVMPAEALTDLLQVILADGRKPGAEIARLPADAVAH